MSISSWIIFGVYIIMMGLDFYSTFSAGGELIDMLEANPVYIYTGSWTLIILLNLFVLYLLLKANDSKAAGSRFVACNFFVWFSILRGFVIVNNLKINKLVIDGTLTAANLVNNTETVRLSAYLMKSIAMLYAPILITLVVYLFFIIDNKVVKRWK